MLNDDDLVLFRATYDHQSHDRDSIDPHYPDFYVDKRHIIAIGIWIRTIRQMSITSPAMTIIFTTFAKNFQCRNTAVTTITWSNHRVVVVVVEYQNLSVVEFFDVLQLNHNNIYSLWWILRNTKSTNRRRMREMIMQYSNQIICKSSYALHRKNFNRTKYR